MRRICVFCGSSPGARPDYLRAARQLGCTLAERRIGLVYGGARVGMMGAIAETMLERGADVIGVIPGELAKREVAFEALTDLRIVGSMHERKALMAQLSDGFIALPGGLGTIEEFFEIVTWAQLGIHAKPCGLLNVAGYFDRLVAFLAHCANERFIEADHRALVMTAEDPQRLLAKFQSYRPPTTDKAQWALGFSQT